MLGKKLLIFISIIYGILLVCYTIAFALGKVPCQESDTRKCVNFCCGDDNNADCDKAAIRRNFVDRHNYSDVLEQLNDNFTITKLNTYRCRMEAKPNFSDVFHWRERGYFRFENQTFTRFCLKEVKSAQQNDPNNDWELLNCEYEKEYFEKITIGVCVVLIIIMVLILFVHPRLGRSVYSRAFCGVICCCPNIVTERTIPENSWFFVFIHFLGIVMIAQWLILMAFEVWYSLKFFGKTSDGFFRTILYNIITHGLFFGLHIFVVGPYVFEDVIDPHDFVREDIAEQFKFATLVSIVIIMLIQIPLLVQCVKDYRENEEKYKEIEYNRMMLLGERLTATILASTIVLIMYAMNCVNWGEFTKQNTNIKIMEYIRFVTEIFSMIVLFATVIIAQYIVEGKYPLMKNDKTAMPPAPKPIYDDDDREVTSKYPDENKF